MPSRSALLPQISTSHQALPPTSSLHPHTSNLAAFDAKDLSIDNMDINKSTINGMPVGESAGSNTLDDDSSPDSGPADDLFSKGTLPSYSDNEEEDGERDSGTDECGRSCSPLPDSILLHRGSFQETSWIPSATKEVMHDAELLSVFSENEQDGVFQCRNLVKLEGTSQKCKGMCFIPNLQLHNNPRRGFWVRSSREFRINDPIARVTRDEVVGLVKLGRVIGDAETGMYTCESDFYPRGGVIFYRGYVHVPKKYVPQYKLVDFEGEKNSVASIETLSPEQTAHQEKLARTATVVFPRPITNNRVDMLVEMWKPISNKCVPDQPCQIIVERIDGDFLQLFFRVPDDKRKHFLHFRGSMHKELTHGRFSADSQEPTPNAQSNALFWELMCK